MNPKRNLILGVLALVIVISVAGVLHQQLSGTVDPYAPPAQQEPGYAADFTLYDREGNPAPFMMGEQPVVLNFWASWCPACTRMMPALQAAYEQFGGDVTFIAVNLVGGRETHDSAMAAIEGNGFTFPVLFDPHREAFGAFGATHLPTTVFINSVGEVIHRQVGTMSESALLEHIESIK